VPTRTSDGDLSLNVRSATGRRDAKAMQRGWPFRRTSLTGPKFEITLTLQTGTILEHTPDRATNNGQYFGRSPDMAGDSGQKFISRNRPPRVQITYDDPYDAERKIELPFVMGVMSDLSGPASDVAKPEVADRTFLDIDMDNFESRMAAIEPGTSFQVANKLGDGAGEKLSVSLKFRKMEDFGPAAVARQVPALAKLLEARNQLANLLRYMDGKVDAEAKLKKLLSDKDLMAALNQRAAESSGTGNDD
jgi:type VI secretion system protein ImpB